MTNNEPGGEVTLADLQSRWERLCEAATAQIRQQALGTRQGIWLTVASGAGLLGLAYLSGWRRGRRKSLPGPQTEAPAADETANQARQSASAARTSAARSADLTGLLTPVTDSLVRYGLRAVANYLDTKAPGQTAKADH